MNKINKLAIFCGSKTGANAIYAQHAEELGKIFGKHHVELIYGGGKKGLMGIVADTVMQAGGIVRGVIPKVLTEWEHQHDKISELLVVDDMHIRKKMMYELCDGAVILPGGFGTMDELFEMLTWNNLSIHDKMIFLLNSGGFYDRLLEHMRFIASEGFLWEKLEDQLVIVQEPKEMEKYLGNHGFHG